MRRILNQAANAAVKYKGSVFQTLYRRYLPRLGHNVVFTKHLFIVAGSEAAGP